ncbi:50S ribosomal protein L10 [Candidatus Thiothrix sp. Deng01]|uniref:Large ribosomal subunit protein uL10 n=2 Tax=Thiothrix TaxID=1030 RepID=A0A7L6AMP8_9GAMM|nr:50S ribosomal protein L10 [Candidatus Thiothrix sp. Deng01]MEB4590567.1 50S ribosomal protein L10 [Candidatus Thiothrix sp. Deng01]QLQ30323.1 MAG: 50S ribosomal protein L10 [Candidatus Thiothrix singaporensis]
MALTLEEKKQIVSEVAGVAARAYSMVAAEYRGMTVDKLTKLRVEARKNGVYLRVVKNNLVRIAVKDTDFECIQDGLVGPLILAFSLEDPGAAARLIKDFIKDKANEKFDVKFVAMSGKMLPASELERLSKMPTREQALATLAGTLRAPLNKFAQTLNEVPGKLVRTIAAIRDQKEGKAA